MSPLLTHTLPWLDAQLAKRAEGKPWVVGISGAQGIGKSTLCAQLVAHYRAQGLNAITVSIDDFYLTRVDQVALAQAHPENPYWQHRGYPGTHDLGLWSSFWDELMSRGDGTLRLPRYDKAAHQGKGDRAPESQWPSVDRPVDLVFWEGWMLGFTPVEPTQIQPQNRALFEANSALAQYLPLTRRMDSWLLLMPEKLEDVVHWRIEAEARMRLERGSGMSDAETEAYIRSFLPAYELYLPALRKGQTPAERPTLSVTLDRGRRPASP